MRLGLTCDEPQLFDVPVVAHDLDRAVFGVWEGAGADLASDAEKAALADRCAALEST